MKLYKYKSIDNLWHILDIVLMKRIYCANWMALNDPLEGRYTTFFQDENLNPIADREGAYLKVNKFRDENLISSLSADGENFLMWSHYSSGHRGVVIELDFFGKFSSLHEISYSPFDAIIGNDHVTTGDFKSVLLCKAKPWEYEKEYRVLYSEKYYPLQNPPCRLILGAKIDPIHEDILRTCLSDKIEIVKAEIDIYQGWVKYD